jgi:RNA polymerase sigma factor (TIGR02999 family)
VPLVHSLPDPSVRARPMSDVTRILSAIEAGDPHAANELLPLVYHELRRLAARKMAHEAPGHTLSATSLVHEAYLRLVDVDHAQHWENRRHFFAAAAEAMRRILVESARRKQSVKHGGGLNQCDLQDVILAAGRPPEHLLSLDEALQKLAAEEPVAAQVAKLRLFAGLTLDDIADLSEMARTTAHRHWTYARAWLRAELSDDEEPESDPFPLA